MSEEATGRSRMERTEHRIDGLLRRVSERRKKPIKRSMQRPLRTEALKTAYILACILVDLVLAPSILFTLLSRPWALVGLVIILPLLWPEFKAHEKWFALTSQVDREKVAQDR